MRLNRWFLTVLVSLVAVTVFAGGDREAGEGEPEYLRATYFNGRETPKTRAQLTETPIGQIIREKLKVEFDVEYLTGDLGTKVGIMIAAEDYPDLVYAVGDHDKFIDAGALVPFDSYIEELGGNTRQYYADLLEAHRQEDGHIYYLSPALPETASDGQVFSGFWLPRHVVDEFDYPEIDTWEDYIAIIREYVERHPTTNGQPTIGFTFIADGWRSFTIENAAFQLAGYPNDGRVVVTRGDDPEDYVAESFIPKDFTKRWFRILNGLWHEGLIDSEAFTLSYDQYLAKLTTGRVIGFFDQRWQFAAAAAAMENQGMQDHLWVPFPVTFDAETPDAYQQPKALKLQGGISITRNARYPERLFKILDAFMEPDIVRLTHWGIEGQDYTVGPDGLFERTKVQRRRAEDPDYMEQQGLRDPWYGFPRFVGFFDDGNAVKPEYQPSEIRKGYSEWDLRVLGSYDVRTYAEMFEPPIASAYGVAWDIDMPDGTPQQIAHEKAKTVKLQYFPKVITADPEDFDVVWAEFMDAWEGIGMDVHDEYVTEVIRERVRTWQ